MMASLAVDFDGVIHSYENGWLDGSIYGTFVPNARKSIIALMSRYAVFVHTTRDPASVAEWIERESWGSIKCITRSIGDSRKFWNDHGVLLVTNVKLPAIAYIDDRAIRFENWKQSMEDLDRFEAIK